METWIACAVLKGVESPEGTPELLLGLSYLIHANPASINTAEKFYRIALQKGQPQAPALLGVLLTAGYIGTTGSPAEGRALIESVLANDRLAWLATSDSYLNGEGGSLDPVKAVSWMVKAAEAGEPYALLQYARLAAEGIGMERNPSLAEGALRRAADLGFSEAELTLANWMMNAYEKKFIDDPAEAVKLEERLAAKHWISAIAALGTFYTFTGRGPLWKDESRGTKLLQECSAFRDLRCHSNLGLALQDGRGVRQDLVTAWAHYDIGRRLSSDRVVMPGLAQIDKIMTPREKDNAHKLSQEIWAGLKDEPPLITLRREP
jgi:TPR repeat protein